MASPYVHSKNLMYNFYAQSVYNRTFFVLLVTVRAHNRDHKSDLRAKANQAGTNHDEHKYYCTLSFIQFYFNVEALWHFN